MKRVLLLTDTIYDFYNGGQKVGGIAVQMSLWAKVFQSHGWRVYSLSQDTEITQNDVTFVKYPRIGGFFGILLEIWLALLIVVKVKPHVLICRGARREMTFFLFWSRLIRSKFVFFGASDNDFKPEEELIVDKKSRLLYRIGLRFVKSCVLQNQNQAMLLQTNYGKKQTLIIPNIWSLSEAKDRESYRDIDFLWVGNFRKLKRPEWFIKLAIDFPTLRFVMVGGAIDQDFYERCVKDSYEVKNLQFMGYIPFNEVNNLFQRTKYYICTSYIEGFPNTFLQAWSNNIPIITSFDPSGLVRKEKIGIVVNDYEELKRAVNELIGNVAKQESLKLNVKKYFEHSHNMDRMYLRLLEFLS